MLQQQEPAAFRCSPTQRSKRKLPACLRRQNIMLAVPRFVPSAPDPVHMLHPPPVLLYFPPTVVNMEFPEVSSLEAASALGEFSDRSADPVEYDCYGGRCSGLLIKVCGRHPFLDTLLFFVVTARCFILLHASVSVKVPCRSPWFLPSCSWKITNIDHLTCMCAPPFRPGRTVSVPLSSKTLFRVLEY